MDQYEKMAKMNKLTKELKQHGFAEDSFQAIQQAQQIYGDEAVSDSVQNGMINHSINEKISRSTEGGTMDESQAINMDKKIQKLSENVNVLTEKINEIVKAINDIDTRMMNLRKTEPKIEQHKEEAKQEPNTSGTERHEEKAEKPKDEYSMNQRVGNYQSTDVAIDKMFYYGKK
jgi:hypothetical protein